MKILTDKDSSIIGTKHIISLLCILACLSCNSQNEDVNTLPPLRKQIAQMLMVGFRGTGPELNSEMIRCVKTEEVGAVILYEIDILQGGLKNIESKEQLTKLVGNLKGASSTGLFVAIDEEGGNVSRLKEKYGYLPTVTAQYLGDTNDSDTTSKYVNNIVVNLSETGINMNCAPCVDVNVNTQSPAIGARGRSFSANPEIVTKYAEIFYDAQLKKGIVSSYKHFPGHGSASSDSHNGFTDITNTWSEKELIPYQELIKDGKCDLIMTAHIFNSNLDSKYPATLSKNIMTGILRDKLGFKGVIVSDDMLMGGIIKQWDIKTAIRLAIEAGVDMLCFSNQPSYDPEISTKIIDTIEGMVKDGSIKEERITQSYNRIQALKKKIAEKKSN